jgi:hypothetical protein
VLNNAAHLLDRLIHRRAIHPGPSLSLVNTKDSHRVSPLSIPLALVPVDHLLSFFLMKPTLVCLLALAIPSLAISNSNSKIDRHRLVSLYNPIRTSSNPTTPIQVGNGNFAFGTDITGLQTFLPFNTLSTWGWKNDSLPPNVTQDDIEAYRGVSWLNHGRPVEYDFGGGNPIEQWLIANPNRVNLGRIGLAFLDDKSTMMKITEGDLKGTRQTLDLWSGTITSEFSFGNTAITVKVASADSTDTVAIQLESGLLANGQLGVFLDFPWCDGTAKFSAPFVGSYNFPENHTTTLQTLSSLRNVIHHTLDSTTYVTTLNGDAHDIRRNSPVNHTYTVIPQVNRNQRVWSLTVTFGTSNIDQPPQAKSVFEESGKVWEDYWSNGGFVDVLTGSTDARANELQRRIILSRYLMRVNEAGDTPPQEVSFQGTYS